MKTLPETGTRPYGRLSVATPDRQRAPHIETN